MATTSAQSRALKITVELTLSTVVGIALDANTVAVTIRATTAAVDLKLASADTTNIFTIQTAVPLRIQSDCLPGMTLYFLSATGGVQIIEEMNAV